MICTSIQRRSYEEILSLLDDPWVEMAEVRLDLCSLSDEQTEDLFSNTDTPLIATCRTGTPGPDGPLSEAEAERRLSLAIRAGARFADLELEASADFSKRFRELCRECGTEIIRSYHDYSGTPSPELLAQIRSRCCRYGADVAKIVVTAHCEEDCRIVEGLYDSPQEGRLVAFAMGDAGRETRLRCLALGAPFTYASCGDGLATASGQYSFEEMHRRVYGGFRGFYRNDLRMPASKSFAQRAIIAAALASGRSRLRNYTPCDDSESAIRAAGALGARVLRSGTTLTVDGAAASAGGTSLEELHAGESGLLTRLMVPLLAVLNDRPVTITGEKTLLLRPLKGIQEIMASFGVPVRSGKVPVEVTPPLIPGNAEISGAGGSQLISGLLYALPLCGKNSTLYVSEPKSIPYMFITEDVLRKFGVHVKSEMEGDESMIEQQDWSGCSQVTFSVRGGQRYKAADLDLEGDWSAAANFLVAGAVFGKAEVGGLATDSLQADLAIVDILVQAGAVVSELDGAVCVSKAPLEAFEADLGNAPDIFPVCSVLAAFCDGITTLRGVGRLRGKESDRALAILEMLTALGVKAQIAEDELQIEGETLAGRILNGRLLRHGCFTTRHDHRMAMALKVASMGMDGPLTLDDAACVSKSFPGFWEMFDY